MKYKATVGEFVGLFGALRTVEQQNDHPPDAVTRYRLARVLEALKPILEPRDEQLKKAFTEYPIRDVPEGASAADRAKIVSENQEAKDRINATMEPIQREEASIDIRPVPIPAGWAPPPGVMEVLWPILADPDSEASNE